MQVDFSEFQVLFEQQLGRDAIITFPSGKTVSGKVKAVKASFVELEHPNVHVSYCQIGFVEFSKSEPKGWNRFPSES
jgi:hypothetical protein